jgi:hypothetical protein
MTVSLSPLLEDPSRIAWQYLDRTSEFGDGGAASRLLSDTIETMIRQGQRSRPAFANQAISANQVVKNLPKQSPDWARGCCRAGLMVACPAAGPSTCASRPPVDRAARVLAKAGRYPA